MTILRCMLLALATMLAGCGESVPEGHRPASAAIAEARQFRSSAADCRKPGGEDRSCAKAIELYERVRSTPTHFATQSEWRQFSDAYGGGVNLMLMSVLKEACDPAAKQAATVRMDSMCKARDPVKIQRKTHVMQ